MRWGPVLVTLVFAVSASPPTPTSGSGLSLRQVSGEPPTLILAQRAIDRSWGPSDDSVYVVADIPEWRSEGWAAMMSAAVPGAGQLYSGQGRRGLWFLLAEATGWVASQVYHRRGDELRGTATSYAGTPTDSSSAWSFTRWARATHGDPSEMMALYAADRESFYDLIAADERYREGWVDPTDGRVYFAGLRNASDARLRYARLIGMGLWLNHLTSAVDALRTARLHNLPLLPKTELKVKSGWRSGSPTLSAAIVRRF